MRLIAFGFLLAARQNPQALFALAPHRRFRAKTGAKIAKK
jgi:hypothetical protein